MRRLLIVSPHFPPTSTPDLHRVRALLPHFPENGWAPEVLAVSPDCVAAPQDEWLANGVPADVPIHRVDALGLGWARVPGFRGLGYRAMRALRRGGDEILSSREFDLVYFSTTVHEVNALGSTWRRRFGVPFVIDYQDPWVNDYYAENASVPPPGGRAKYYLASAIHRWLEPRTLEYAAGITSVSPQYPRQIARRYPALRYVPSLVQPFPAPRQDFERLAVENVVQTEFDPADGNIHWLYAGVIVPSMLFPVRSLFAALRDFGEPDLLRKLRIHFVGTSYAHGADSQILDIADNYGLTSNVFESPARIPYSQALACMRDASALLAIGSDDAGYSPSKLYPYLLAEKPLLALYRQDSPAAALLASLGGAVSLNFALTDSEVRIAAQIRDRWLDEERYERSVPLNDSEFRQIEAPSATAAICEFFSECIDGTQHG